MTEIHGERVVQRRRAIDFARTIRSTSQRNRPARIATADVLAELDERDVRRRWHQVEETDSGVRARSMSSTMLALVEHHADMQVRRCGTPPRRSHDALRRPVFDDLEVAVVRPGMTFPRLSVTVTPK
jgi:hypothetical protein